MRSLTSTPFVSLAPLVRELRIVASIQEEAVFFSLAWDCSPYGHKMCEHTHRCASRGMVHSAFWHSCSHAWPWQAHTLASASCWSPEPLAGMGKLLASGCLCTPNCSMAATSCWFVTATCTGSSALAACTNRAQPFSERASQ